MSAKDSVAVASASGGSGGDDPGRGRKGLEGHYSSDRGPFIPLPPGIKMASPGPNRDAARDPQAPRGRPRAMSLPSANDFGFYMTMRSVLTHGILPQPEMRRRGIDFNPSHDGPLRDADHVEVTRVPKVDGLRQQREVSRAAVENPHHGSLTVSLERSVELGMRRQTDEEVRGGMDLMQRFEMLRMPSEDVSSVLNGRRSNVLSGPSQIDEANRRMRSTFSILSPSSESTVLRAPFEAQRPSIEPSQMREVHVPFMHLPDARRVIQDMRDRGRRQFPTLTGVGDTNALAPQYNTRHGDRVDTQGVTAPSYHQALTQSVSQHGTTDQHVVKTPLGRGGGGGGGGLAPMPMGGGGRKRSNTI